MLIEKWSLIKFFGLQDWHLFKVGAYLRLSAYLMTVYGVLKSAPALALNLCDK